MHDFHEADKIFKLVMESAQKNNLKKVTKINIELGSVIEHGEEISAENISENIKLLAKDSLAEDAEVVIKKINSDNIILRDIEGE